MKNYDVIQAAFLKAAAVEAEGFYKEAWSPKVVRLGRGLKNLVRNPSRKSVGIVAGRARKALAPQTAGHSFLGQVGDSLRMPFERLRNPVKRYGKLQARQAAARRRYGKANRPGADRDFLSRQRQARDAANRAVDDFHVRNNLATTNMGGTRVSRWSDDVIRASRANNRAIVSDRTGLGARITAGGLAYGGAQGAGYGAGLLAGGASADKDTRHLDHLANLGFGDRLMAIYNPQAFAQNQMAALNESNPHRQGVMSILPGMAGYRAGRRRVDRAVTSQMGNFMNQVPLHQRLGYAFAPQFAINQLRDNAANT